MGGNLFHPTGGAFSCFRCVEFEHPRPIRLCWCYHPSETSCNPSPPQTHVTRICVLQLRITAIVISITSTTKFPVRYHSRTSVVEHVSWCSVRASIHTNNTNSSHHVVPMWWARWRKMGHGHSGSWIGGTFCFEVGWLFKIPPISKPECNGRRFLRSTLHSPQRAMRSPGSYPFFTLHGLFSRILPSRKSTCPRHAHTLCLSRRFSVLVRSCGWVEFKNYSTCYHLSDR